MNADRATVRVKVTNHRSGHQPVTLDDGDILEFGRTVGGVGRISEDPAVSRVHGIIEATSDGFFVSASGSQVGITVADRTTPSKLVVPRGVGPVLVPFRDCSIIVELPDDRAYLNVSVEGCESADRWAESWGPEMRDKWFSNEQRSALGTRDLLEHAPVRWRKSNGKPYAWYRTLVALCEPALSDQPAGTPTNKQLQARLHQSKSVTERHLTEIYTAFGFADQHPDRELVVRRAIDLGLVTRADVEQL